MGLRSHFERSDCPGACVREDYVDVAVFLLHDGIEPIQIFQTRHVAHDRRNVFRDEGRGVLQLFFASPGDHDVRAFVHEALGGGQPDPAASARDDGDLAF
jgi:hypothetical protein